MAITLADLAQQQQNNPQNTYLNSQSNTSVPVDNVIPMGNEADAQAIAQSQQPLPPTPAPTVQPTLQPAQESQAYVDQEVREGRMTQEQANAAKANGEIIQPERQAISFEYPQLPSTRRTTLAPSSVGGVPGAQLSPERQWLKDSGEVAKDVQGTIQGQESSVQKQQDILAEGIQSAAGLHSINEMNDSANALSIKLARQHFESDQEEQSRQREAEWQEQRARKIDPSHWFKNAGVGGSILAALSMAGGAFAAAMPHTNTKENAALGIINHAIDRDIDAQKEDINQGWKSLDWKGKEDDRNYVRGMYTIQQQELAKQRDYSHGIALADRQIQGANSRSEIEGLQQVKAGLQMNLDKSKQGEVDRKLSVMVKERAAASAASAANPFSAQNEQKAYMEYRKDAEKANSEHPDKPVEILSLHAWRPGYEGQGRAAGKGGSAAQNDAFDAGVNEIGTAGKNAATATAGDWILSNLPAFMAPGSNMAMDHMNQYNEGMLPAATRLLGDRVPPESIAKQVKAFEISSAYPEEVNNERIAAFQNFLRTNRNVNIGAKKGTEIPTDEGIPGATEVK